MVHTANATETKRYVLIPQNQGDYSIPKRMVFDIDSHGRGKVAMRDSSGNRTIDFFVVSSKEYDCFTDYKVEVLKNLWINMKKSGWIEETNP